MNVVVACLQWLDVVLPLSNELLWYNFLWSHSIAMTYVVIVISLLRHFVA